MTSSDSKTSTKLILILIGTGALLIGGFVFLRCRSDVSGLSYCSTLGLVNPGVYKDRAITSERVLLFKDKVEENAFSEVTIVDMSRDGFRQFLIADRMKYSPDELRWEFINGKVLTITPDGAVTSADFDRYYYPFPEELSSGRTSVPIIKIEQ